MDIIQISNIEEATEFSEEIYVFVKAFLKLIISSKEDFRE